MKSGDYGNQFGGELRVSMCPNPRRMARPCGDVESPQGDHRRRAEALCDADLSPLTTKWMRPKRVHTRRDVSDLPAGCARGWDGRIRINDATESIAAEAALLSTPLMRSIYL